MTQKSCAAITIKDKVLIAKVHVYSSPHVDVLGTVL